MSAFPHIAVASSGVGWVGRGNETWAVGLAGALHGAGLPVTLFGGGPLQLACAYRRVRTWRRDCWLTRPFWSWGRRYAVEQSVFALRLVGRLRPLGCQVVHTGDPQVAWGLHKRRRRSGCPVVYKDGLLLGPVWNRNFDWVQVLAPHYLDEAQRQNVGTAGWRVIPHFVDPERFAPAKDRAAARHALFGDALPADAFVVLAAGALAPESSKRLDWVVSELAAVPGAHLVVVGQAEAADLAAFERLARPRLGGRLQVRANLNPAEMPRYYQAADLFVHAALREPFGIVLIEALASGLPVLGHRFPVTGWIIGDGGEALDMEAPGALAGAVAELAASPARRTELGQLARAQAVQRFSPDAVLPLYREFYQAIQARESARAPAAP